MMLKKLQWNILNQKICVNIYNPPPSVKLCKEIHVIVDKWKKKKNKQNLKPNANSPKNTFLKNYFRILTCFQR